MENNNLDLSQVVNGLVPDEDVVNNTKDQLRVFLIAQAKKELERVIKLTNTLDLLETKYQNKVEEYIEEHNDDSAIMYLPVMIENITKCLERSQEIISKVIGNDKIMNFSISSNNTINIDSNNQTLNLNLQDPQSRNRVINAVKSIIEDINKI